MPKKQPRPPPPPTIEFPVISPKKNLHCEALLEDQIIVIENYLTPSECASYVRLIDTLPLELTPPKKRGEADRVNYRLSIPSPAFAKTLHQTLTPHLLSLHPDGFNSNIRFYKYSKGQYFGGHYDDSTIDRTTKMHSEWTLLVYLTGVEDGVEGGKTLFYKTEKEDDVVLSTPLHRGTALLHRHGNDCLFHEGSVVRRGVKYVLRSDVMYL